MIPDRSILICDTECYINYWLVKFYDPLLPGVSICEFELFENTTLDYAGLFKILNSYTLITFNGTGYDILMLTLAMSGASCSQLKSASDLIIQTGIKWWEFYDRLGLQRLPYIDQIDVQGLLKGKGVSLKLYGARLNSKFIQDLPIEPNAVLIPSQMKQINRYNTNDCLLTYDAYLEVKPAIDLRLEMSKKFGIDLRSKSDAQMAEAIIKSQLSFKPALTRWKHGTKFKYEPPSFIKFSKKYLDDIFKIIKNAEFTTSDAMQTELHAEDEVVKTGVIIPNDIENLIITINKTNYKLGLGGLHSMEKSVHYESSPILSICDADVTSYYPSLILLCEIIPPNLGLEFLNIYRNIYNTRLDAKKKNRKVESEGLKIVLNGTFGKFGNKYSILFAPDLLIKVTLTGQLSLLMLISMLEENGIRVGSANTDGIVMLCPLGYEFLRDQIIKYWEALTGLTMEYTNYKSIYCRDVNNYIAFKKDGTPKTKGTFANLSIDKNPHAHICVEAVINFLRDKIPLLDTIKNCKNIREFISAQKVQGGAVEVTLRSLPQVTSKEELLIIAGYGLTSDKPKRFGQHAHEKITLGQAYKEACEQLSFAAKSEPIGKVVRYYYAKNKNNYLAYATSGNKVPSSEGSQLCMELPEQFPIDIDYEKYESIAKELLTTLSIE